MNRIPLDESLLLESLPGFSDLTTDEKERISVVSFEYSDYPCLFSADLDFEYRDENGRKMRLKFEMSGNRSEDHFYQHVMFEETGEEIEFPDFRKAIDFCNQKDRSEPDWGQVKEKIPALEFPNKS